MFMTWSRMKMRCRRTDCISRPLAGLFAKLGAAIGSSPLWFFIIPILFSVALSGGFIFLRDRESNDLEDQFTPSKGPSKAARAFVKENFPHDDSMFSEDRLYSHDYFASVIAVARKCDNILDSFVYEDVIKLHRRILNITVVNGTGFNDLCARVNGECSSNVILEIISSNETRITFPVHTHRSSPVFLGSVLGGVVTNADGSIRSAQAVKLFYNLKSHGNPTASTLWLRAFKSLLSDVTDHQHVDVSYYTSKSKQEEIDSHTEDGFPLFFITYAIAITFSVISCLRMDNVRNKVWVAVFGALSAGLAIISSFGLLLFIGVPFVITVANSPFLILGIGLNNMFILVSDWQHTHVQETVPKRMAHTYKEAVMSITITAVTDMVKFSIGVKSDFPSVQSFCVYTATSIMFCYVYTITFFGAFLALNGRREQSNRHWLTCRRVPVDTCDDSSQMYNSCCVGGGFDKNTGAEKMHPVSNFFKDYYGPFLIKPWVKGAVILLYVAYLTISIYGCFHIEQGIELQDLAADDSHVTRFNRKDRQYFSDYGPSVMVIVRETFPYWDQNERYHIEACMSKFRRLDFVHDDIYTSWLDSYLDFGQERGLDLNSNESFLENLSPFFKLHPLFKQDLNLTGGAIHASRFFIQTVDIANASMEITMLSELRSVADRCQVASLSVYHPDFIFFDQYDVVVTSTIKNVGVIAAVMLFVSLLLIPNPLGSLWVTCSIGSVTAGVTGFKAFWDVSLDSISMIIFTVCIGFTVDFSAHITYGFFSSEKSSPNDKAVEALSNLGYPILQGASSTILGVSVLAVSEFHTFRTFFKLFFLVMSIGMVHGLTFIPVILTLFTCSSEEKKRKPEICAVTQI